MTSKTTRTGDLDCRPETHTKGSTETITQEGTVSAKLYSGNPSESHPANDKRTGKNLDRGTQKDRLATTRAAAWVQRVYKKTEVPANQC